MRFVKEVTEEDHECLKALSEKWEMPFYKPIMYSREKNTFAADTWAIKVFNLTPSGGMSKKGAAHLLFDFCPICGERISPTDDPPGADRQLGGE